MALGMFRLVFDFLVLLFNFAVLLLIVGAVVAEPEALQHPSNVLTHIP